MNRPGPALDNVLATISHDLRTPLSVVHTTISMLLNPRYQLSAQQVREQHERISRNIELMNRMVGELADMGALHEGTLPMDLKPLSIIEVLRDAVPAHEAAALEKGVQLTFDAGPDELTAVADRARLLQLFQNLLGSALKNCEAGDRIAVASCVREHHAHIEIADNGTGIAAEDLPNLFDPSCNKKHLRSGAGLGLYIAKGIVEAHGGEIRCGATPGGGITFNLSLPLTP